MYLISYNFYHEKARFTTDSLVNRLGLPTESIQEALRHLLRKNLIIEIDGNPGEYLPAKDIDTMKLYEILDSVREKGEEKDLVDKRSLFQPEVDGVFHRIDKAIENTLGQETIKELVLSTQKDMDKDII